MDNLWPAVISLAAVLVGAFVAHVGQLRYLEVQTAHQQKTLAHSIAAEIEAYLAIVRRRGHVEGVQAVVAQLEQGSDAQFPRLLSPDDTPLGQFPVFSALLPRIGELGPLAGDVAEFYTIASGVRSTLIFGARGAFDRLPATSKAEIIKGELAVWRDVEKTGAALIPKLRALGART